MYQRMLIVSVPRSGLDAEKISNQDADDLVRDKEKDRGHRDHDEHHDSGDHGLAAGRPGDLGGLRAHFLQEFERAESHRRLSASIMPE